MILTQLETYKLPRSLTRVLKHSLKQAETSSRRFIKAKIRRTKTRTLAAVRRQYYFSHAYGDMRRSVSRNEDIFITSAIVVAVLAYAASVTGANFILMFLNTGYGISEITGINVLVTLLTAGMILGVLYFWLLSFLMNLLSISIMDGATGKKYRSIRSTFRKSLSRASSVSGAWLALLGLIALPPTALAGGLLTFLHFHPLPTDAILDLVAKALGVAVAWVFLILMNFSLAPYVALFEPPQSLPRIFARSYRLVKTRGRIFLLLGYSILAFGLLLSLQLSVWAEKFLMLNQWVAFSFFCLAIMVFANGILTSLYRKRKLARK